MNPQESPYRRDPVMRKYVDEILANFHEVSENGDPKIWGPDEMSVGFMRDANPTREVSVWLVMSRKFRGILDADTYPLEQAQDVFLLVLGWGIGHQSPTPKATALTSEQKAKIWGLLTLDTSDTN